jgi:hypothetical protein
MKRPKNTANVYVEPTATVPVLVVGDGPNAFGWKANGQPTGLYGVPGRGFKPRAAQLRSIGGTGAGMGDLRGRWSGSAESTPTGGVRLVLRRSLGKVKLTITGEGERVDGPWSWAWLVERSNAAPVEGKTPRAGIDWPDVCKAALRAALDLETSKCGAENLTRRGASSRQAAQLGRDVPPAGQTSARPRGELVAEAGPVAQPAKAGTVRRAPKAGAQAGLFGA